MPVDHSTSVSGGDTVASAGWNAEHVVIGAHSMIAFTFIADPTGFDYTVSSTGYEDIGVASLILPGSALNPDGYNTAKLIASFHGDSSPANKYVRIYNVTDAAEVVESSLVTSNSYSPTISAFNSYTFPTGDTKEYRVEVKSSNSSEQISLYQIVLLVYIS